MYDGSTAIFERVKRPDAVTSIATVGDMIIIEDQEQPASKPFISLPGGCIDKGEDPLAAAKRELLEETGYVSEHWIPFMQQCPDASGERSIFTFIARDCTAHESGSHLDAGEKIALRLVNFDDFLALSDEPRFRGRDIVDMLLRARLDAGRRAQLHASIFGS